MHFKLQVFQKASKWAPFVFILFVFFGFTSLVLLFLPAHQVYAESSTPAFLNNNNCRLKQAHETVRVSHVYDGDTIKLKDGRKLRLIGINTSERGRDGETDQPFYQSAKSRLQQIINQNRALIKIIPGKQKQDRHKRLLAHIFSVEGTNITATLLSEGLGFSVIIPPNLQFLNCYQRAEKAAEKLKRGIWAHRFSKPVEANLLTTNKSNLGFKRVIGKVQRINQSSSAYWLTIEDSFVLRIMKKDLRHFQDYHPETLLNKKVIAKGWISRKKNNLRMSIQHPLSLIIQNTD